jgi:Xaa-Pro aminopeptidase
MTSANTFQSFEPAWSSDPSAGRMENLCKQLVIRGLDAFLVPHADEYHNEYLPASAERLAWLTGFSGSAGSMLVLRDKALLFVDGRYTLQAEQEVDKAVVTVIARSKTPMDAWLSTNLPAGTRVGYHGWLHTAAEIEKINKAIVGAKATLVALEKNPIDDIWTDKPALPASRLELHEESFAGERMDSKILRAQRALLDAKVDAVVVTDAHTVNWLLNIRGKDIAHTPLALAHMIVSTDERPKLFVSMHRIPNEVRRFIERDVEILEPQVFDATLFAMGRQNLRVRVDPSITPERVRAFLSGGGAKVEVGPDPVQNLKSVKNKTEIEGAYAAHLRDGIAMCRFLAWFDSVSSSGQETEVTAASKLEHFRRETGELQDLSFPTIAGMNANGAIVHYRPLKETCLPISEGLFLIDSGGQYRDGTTDITRTICVGAPTDEMKERYTRVLKGHIALATARFPKGTAGAQLDPFARRSLWEAGLDYDHGTGHGVGSYLSVHEGDARISKTGQAPLIPGMILSNEPAYYKEGAYGIRLENLMLVVDTNNETSDRPVYGFEILTLVPFDRSLIELHRLSMQEKNWIEDYHQSIKTRLMPLLDSETRKWLEAATEPF